MREISPEMALFVAPFKNHIQATKAYVKFGREIADNTIYIIAEKSDADTKMLTEELRCFGATKIENFDRYQELEISIRVPTKMPLEVAHLMLNKESSGILAVLFHLCGQPKIRKKQLTFKYRGPRIHFFAKHPKRGVMVNSILVGQRFVDVPSIMQIKTIREYSP